MFFLLFWYDSLHPFPKPVALYDSIGYKRPCELGREYSLEKYNITGTITRQTNIRRDLKKIAADFPAIGRRIREIRGFDLTQVEFGRILGITQAQLSKYELGQSAPTPDILLKLKVFSGKHIDWILTGEEPKAAE